MRRFVAVIAGLGVLVAGPVAAQEATTIDAPVYLAMFDDADHRGVALPPADVFDLFVGITGEATVDARIRAAAEARGYRRQFLSDTELVEVDGRLLQASAAEAWTELKAAARADGISLVLTSAYRDLRSQQSLFRGRLGGRTSDAAIDATLQIAAPPGYSKHHSGFAIDVGQPGVTRDGFVNTAAYAWMSAFDFAWPKFFGFVPSYPEDGEQMGPDAEPWELVWVGTGRIACAASAVHSSGFCDVAASQRTDDIVWLVDLGVTVGCRPGRFCADDPLTRGEAASMLWRLHGAPTTERSAPFVDVFADDHFAAAVAWLWAAGVVEGTSETTFSPDEFLSPDEAFALLVRLAGVADRPVASGLSGPIPGFASEPVEVGDLGVQISRAEFASVLRAAAVG